MKKALIFLNLRKYVVLIYLEIKMIPILSYEIVSTLQNTVLENRSSLLDR